MDNFKEYMWYLLTTPFKRAKKSVNAWWIYCRVIGGLFDDAKEALDRAREEGMVATCSDELLPIHASERRLTRYAGESEDNFRRRIAMYEEVSILGGLSSGIILAVKSLGYNDVEVISVPDFLGDSTRWAEFYLILNLTFDEVQPVPLDVLKRYVRRWKKSSALDNYFFRYVGDINEPNNVSLSLVTYRKYISYFGYRQLDGWWQLDGTYYLDENINDYPTYIGYKYPGGTVEEYVVGAMAAYRSGSLYEQVDTAFTLYAYKVAMEYAVFLKMQLCSLVYRLALINNITSVMSAIKYMLSPIIEEPESIQVKEGYLIYSDYYDYLMLNGLWNLTGSKLLDAQQVNNGIQITYQTSIYNTITCGQIIYHKEHNLFYLDGSELLNGSRNLDTYEETEVL